MLQTNPLLPPSTTSCQRLKVGACLNTSPLNLHNDAAAGVLKPSLQGKKCTWGGQRLSDFPRQLIKSGKEIPDK